MVRSTIADIDDASLANVKIIRSDDMSLIRRVLLHSKVLNDVRMVSPTEAATVNFDTKSQRLQNLAFNTGKACIVEILNCGLFQHAKETLIF